MLYEKYKLHIIEELYPPLCWIFFRAKKYFHTKLFCKMEW